MEQQATVDIYTDMFRMREFELLIGAGVASGEIHGEMHLGIGQEIVAAVLARHLKRGDAVVSTHRPHLHGLACGVDPIAMLAEIFERDGLNHGKGGHMHLFDPASNFMCTGIVGASAPLAAGYALKQRLAATGNISVAVAGDGAVNQGAVAETMNLAAVRGLPMLFLVEDNGYGISVSTGKSTAGRIADRARALGIPAWEASGISIDDISKAIGQSVATVRESGQPAMAVVRVYRFRGHYEGDADQYRDTEEKELAMSQGQDPLLVLRSAILAEGILAEAALAELEETAIGVVSGWHSRARSAAMPAPASAQVGVFADE